MAPLRKPEVMSPAGYWPQLRAAIEAGADAVYFGLKHFTARAKVGFSLAELPEVMATLHRRGVKGYITFNTLVFNHELDEAARALAGDRRGGGGRADHPGRGRGAHGEADRARSGDSRQHADERDERRWGATGAELRGQPGDAGARVVAGRGALHPGGDRLRTGDLRPRRAVRGVLGAVLLVGGVGRAHRQSRAVRAGLPAAVRDDGGWPAAAAGRRALPAFAGRSLRAGAGAGDCRYRHFHVEDRRPVQGRRLRGADYRGLSPGGG